MPSLEMSSGRKAIFKLLQKEKSREADTYIGAVHVLKLGKRLLEGE